MYLFCSVSFAVSHSSTIELKWRYCTSETPLVISMMAAVVVGDGWSSTTTDCTKVTTLRPLHTHNTAAHTGLQVSSFQCLWLWLSVWAKKEQYSIGRRLHFKGPVFQECFCTFQWNFTWTFHSRPQWPARSCTSCWNNCRCLDRGTRWTVWSGTPPDRSRERREPDPNPRHLHWCAVTQTNQC